ncbi:hypothetical protein [Algivirga pacifica]|uniref:Fibrobacter succinogenes major paralogous domain-containing protein n=1 Tax=Algivirga pacifica TaxID=1162670 RepID=A0ABP9D1E6_9BACT
MKIKRKLRIISLLISSIALFQCSENKLDDDDLILRDFEQYTPNQADWSTFTNKPLDAGNTSHDPDGVFWISAEKWENSRWDGSSICDPTQMSREEFLKCLFPESGDILKGIYELYYEHQPFADPKNPTKAEVDEWHRIVINHLRALVGYTTEDRQVQKDHCLFARALWGDQRKFTTMWDEKYPGNNGSAYGPCQDSGNAHCGASFVPDAEDQAAYLPEGYDACGTPGGAEGVFSAAKSNIPWSIKICRGISQTIGAEGFWGGHTGPWFHREKFGLSFWDNDPTNNNNNAILRAKWGGKLMPSLYCNPAKADCD